MANAVTNSFEADREHHKIDKPVNIIPIIPLKRSKRNEYKIRKQVHIQHMSWQVIFNETDHH